MGVRETRVRCIRLTSCMGSNVVRSPVPRRPVPLRRRLRQGAPGSDGVGVVGAEDAFADGEGALEEGAGGGHLPALAETLA